MDRLEVDEQEEPISEAIGLDAIMSDTISMSSIFAQGFKHLSFLEESVLAGYLLASALDYVESTCFILQAV